MINCPESTNIMSQLNSLDLIKDVYVNTYNEQFNQPVNQSYYSMKQVTAYKLKLAFSHEF